MAEGRGAAGVRALVGEAGAGVGTGALAGTGAREGEGGRRMGLPASTSSESCMKGIRVSVQGEEESTHIHTQTHTWLAARAPLLPPAAAPLGCIEPAAPSQAHLDHCLLPVQLPPQPPLRGHR